MAIKIEPAVTLVKPTNQALSWLPSHFVACIWTSCCHYRDARERGVVEPGTATKRDHWIPCGHPGATLALAVPSPCLKCPGTKGAIPLSPGGQLQDWHTWDLSGGHGLALKSHWNCTKQITSNLSPVEIEFPTCFREAATHSVNHYLPKFLFPAKAPPVPPNEGTWGVCSMCGHHHPSSPPSVHPWEGEWGGATTSGSVFHVIKECNVFSKDFQQPVHETFLMNCRLFGKVCLVFLWPQFF